MENGEIAFVGQVKIVEPHNDTELPVGGREVRFTRHVVLDVSMQALKVMEAMDLAI